VCSRTHCFRRGEPEDALDELVRGFRPAAKHGSWCRMWEQARHY
jgi:hypothetical protein